MELYKEQLHSLSVIKPVKIQTAEGQIISLDEVGTPFLDGFLDGACQCMSWQISQLGFPWVR